MWTKGFPVFRLFLDDRIFVWPWAMILSSRNDLNTGNPFVHIPKQLLVSDSDNNFLPQPNALTKIRLYPENKIWIRIILLSGVNKQLWILIPSLNISHYHKHSDNLFISRGSIQFPSGGQKLICLRCWAPLSIRDFPHMIHGNLLFLDIRISEIPASWECPLQHIIYSSVDWCLFIPVYVYPKMPQPHHQSTSMEEVENPWCQSPE